MWACLLAIITSSVGHKTNHTTLWSPYQYQQQQQQCPLRTLSFYMQHYCHRLDTGFGTLYRSLFSMLDVPSFLYFFSLYFFRLPAERIKYDHLYNGRDSNPLCDIHVSTNTYVGSWWCCVWFKGGAFGTFILEYIFVMLWPLSNAKCMTFSV